MTGDELFATTPTNHVLGVDEWEDSSGFADRPKGFLATERCLQLDCSNNDVPYLPPVNSFPCKSYDGLVVPRIFTARILTADHQKIRYAVDTT